MSGSGIYDDAQLARDEEALFPDVRERNDKIRASVRRDEAFRDRTNYRRREEERQEKVLPEQVIAARLAGDPFGPLLEKARAGKEPWGNAYVCTAKMLVAGFGPIDEGALYEARGAIQDEPTVKELSLPLEDRQEYPAQEGVIEIRLLTARAVRR